MYSFNNMKYRVCIVKILGEEGVRKWQSGFNFWQGGIVLNYYFSVQKELKNLPLQSISFFFHVSFGKCILANSSVFIIIWIAEVLLSTDNDLICCKVELRPLNNQYGALLKSIYQLHWWKELNKFVMVCSMFTLPLSE